LHEPKGVSTAVINKVYKSNGAGSGTWDDVDSAMLQGLSGDAGITDKQILTDGENGFKLRIGDAYASQTVTNNAVNFPMVAIADTTFNTPTQFSLFTGVGAPWLGEHQYGVAFSVDRLTATTPGIYILDFWCNIQGFTGNTARICFRHRLNGVTYVTRKPTIKSAIAADTAVISAFGLVTMAANDYIQLTVASDTTGNLLISDANMTLRLIRATA
jgi:hypothetical protein